MTNKVRLKNIEIDGQVYPVPSNVSWHKNKRTRHWVVSINKDGKQHQTSFWPSQYNNSLKASLEAAAEYAQKHRIIPAHEITHAQSVYSEFLEKLTLTKDPIIRSSTSIGSLNKHNTANYSPARPCSAGLSLRTQGFDWYTFSD